MEIFAFLGLGCLDTLALFFVLAIVGLAMAAKSAAKSGAVQNVAGKAVANTILGMFKK